MSNNFYNLYCVIWLVCKGEGAAKKSVKYAACMQGRHSEEGLKGERVMM